MNPKKNVLKAVAWLALILLIFGRESKEFEWNVLAVHWTADQDKLAQIAVDTDRQDVRDAAMKKLNDQAVLAKIARKAPLDAQKAAMEKLTDLASLLNVAMDADDLSIRYAAFCKLADNSAFLGELSCSAKDPRKRLFSSVFQETHRALQPAPKGQWERLFEKISEITSLLTIPGVRADLGDIETVQIQWEPRSADYMIVGAVPGESVTVSVKFGKREQAVKYNWTTDFPWRTSRTHFIDAGVSAVDFYMMISGLLSETTHAELALDSGNAEIRFAAAEKITDQATLAKIAVKDDWPYCNTSHIRKTAVQKLTNQVALAKVAMEDRDCEVRFNAVQSLTWQDVLAKIAANDSNLAVRNAALARITDPAVAKKIAARIRKGAVPSAVIAVPVQAEPSAVQPAPLAPKELLTDPTFIPRSEPPKRISP